METIKKLLPGKDKDDETLYGQGSGNTTTTTGQSTHTGGLSGEGSHFGQTKDTSSGLAGQQGTGVTSTHGAQSTTNSGVHSSNLANAVDPRVDSDNSKLAGSGGAHDTRNDGLGVGQGGGLGQRENQQYGTANTGLGNTQSLGTSGTQTAGPHSSDLANKADPRVDSDNSKLTSSRNDGLGVGQGGGLGHRDNQQYGTGSTGIGNTQNSGNSGTQTAGPHSSDLANKVDPRVDSDNSKSHQYGRDAAVAGAAGGAAYGATQHHGNTTSGPHSSDLANRADPRVDSDNSKLTGQGESGGYAPTSGGSYHTGPSGSAVSGPHSTSTANRLDPSVNTAPTRLEDAHKHDQKHGGGAEAADHSHGLGSSGSHGNASKDHNYGRDAALAGGAAGIGAGAYGAGRNDHTSSTTTPHDSNLANRADPRVDTSRSNVTGGEGQTQHHGRDAALAGGAAGIGAGAYGASRNDHTSSTTTPHDSNLANRADPRVDTSRSNVTGGVGQTQPHGVSTSTTTHTSTTTSGPHSSNLANKADPTVDSDNSKSHHGRDAALVGGAGAAGAGAYGAHKHNEHDEKDLKKAEKEADKDRKHAEKEHEKELKHAEKDHDKHDKHEKKEHKGFLSFLHRDKSKKYSKEEEDEFDRQEREHDSNTKRNAALGAGAGVAAGGAAHGAHHHSGTDHADTNKPLPVAPGSSTTGQHNTGHSSTTGHQGPIPEAEKPAGTTIGDILHGVERNRGVPGPTGFPDEQARHDVDEFGNPRGSVAGQGGSSNISRGHDGTATGLGLGAGSGAGALGSNDHRKHQIETAASANQHQSSGGITSTGLTDRTKHGDNTTTHSSGLTGSHHGTGVGQSGNTSGQYDNTTGQSTGLTGSNQTTGYPHQDTTATRDSNYVSGSGNQQHSSSGLTGNNDIPRQYDSNTTGTRGLGEHGSTGLGESGSGRNKLHKDPPAGHIASQSGGLDGDNNGVKNSRAGENTY